MTKLINETVKGDGEIGEKNKAVCWVVFSCYCSAEL
jgi:hypothetical protein